MLPIFLLFLTLFCNLCQLTLKEVQLKVIKGAGIFQIGAIGTLKTVFNFSGAVFLGSER